MTTTTRPSRSKAAVADRAAKTAKANADKLSETIAEATAQLAKRNEVARMDTTAKRETAVAPQYKPFTTAEKEQFNARIRNEKANIWRICNAQPERIIAFCNENIRDEKNAAVRFARRDALAWAVRTQQPVNVPF
jgi:hypothetical protein